MAIGSGVLLPGVAENPTFPILSALAYTTGLGYRPTCDISALRCPQVCAEMFPNELISFFVFTTETAFHFRAGYFRDKLVSLLCLLPLILLRICDDQNCSLTDTRHASPPSPRIAVLMFFRLQVFRSAAASQRSHVMYQWSYSCYWSRS